MMAQDDCTTATATITFYRNGGSPTPVYDEYSFSVALNKKVVFAPGNLKYSYSGGTGVFSFYENQYGYENVATQPLCGGSYGDSYTIDLFGFGTSGLGASPKHPNLLSCTNSDYVNENLTHDNQYDWGSNAIGAYAANTWSTPSSAEWDYLFFHRANWSNLQGNGRINVSGETWVNGIIILPDNWVAPAGISFTPITKINDLGDNNKYTLEQWTVMENAGAVFLPAAGYAGDERPSDNLCSCYMSSSNINNDKFSRLTMCCDFITKIEDTDKKWRAAVRLVRNAVLPVYEPHYFSVSAGNKVKFAPGNVHYNGSAYTFLSNQYSYGRNADANNRDLFDFKSDWISESINGDEAGRWNNLTKAEWDYLLARSEGGHVMWTHAKVNGTYGLVLLPDDWNNTSVVTVVYGHNYGDDNVNSYSVVDWQALEAIGAVFLPGAGNYENHGNNCAMYMSLTPSEGSKYYLMCSCKDFDPKWEGDGGVALNFGAAVRPVRAAEIVTP